MSWRSLPAVLALALLAAACAQAPLPAVPAGEAAALQPPAGVRFESWLQDERARVARQRSAAQQRYRDEELICWRRFAVNDCLNGAKRQRRATLDALREQDLQLNALQRERRTAERLRSIEQKATPATPAASSSVQGRQ